MSSGPDSGFDDVITHPGILPLSRRLLGDGITFEEFSVTVREPIEEKLAGGIKQQAWHRDDCHRLDHPLLLQSLSVVIYLTDVDDGATQHTFSIMPESLATKRGLPGVGNRAAEERLLEEDAPLLGRPDPARPAGAEGSAFDVVGKAGTAIFFHTGNLHAGTVRQTPVERRSIHLYYGHADQPPLSNHLTATPRRLSESADRETRRLFSKKNEVTKVFEGAFDPGPPTESSS